MEHLNCQFCGKQFKNDKSLHQHIIRCKNNPDHIPYSEACSHVAWNKGRTAKDDPRIAKIAETFNKNHALGKHDGIWGKPHSRETKEKISKLMRKICSERHSSLCGKGKRGVYKGFYCQSSWELAYVIYQLDHDIQFERNNKGFSYIWNGETRTYFPDFYIPSEDTYIEVKGYYDARSKAKYDQFNGKLKVLLEKDMKPMIKYVEEKYGKDFVRLYE